MLHSVLLKRRYDDLKLEKKLVTLSWDRPANLSIFIFFVVDNYNVATQLPTYEETSCVFFM